MSPLAGAGALLSLASPLRMSRGRQACGGGSTALADVCPRAWTGLACQLADLRRPLGSHPSVWESLPTCLIWMGNSTSSSLGKSATAPVNQIQETISDNCVVIFSKTSCSYCTMAKKLFHDINVNYKVVELDMLEYGSQFQDALYKMTGERTVPRIFVNGTFIGGATDTHRLHKEGKLLPLVHQCYLKKSKRKDF
ncbi:glutaredoxin 2 isoform X1 [Diceros bicornis minor]|nr:glutaredoxin 2 isoform X1 [Diceros bicornis minor]